MKRDVWKSKGKKVLSFTNKMNSELGGFHTQEVYKSPPVNLTCVAHKSENKL